MKATPLKNCPKKGCTVFTVRSTMACCRLRFFLFLRVYKFRSCKDRNGKHDSSCPKGLFLSLSCNTVTTSIFCCFSSMPVEKILGQSFPFCYTCQLLMEILIASIKYFSKTCPQIQYHSYLTGPRKRAVNRRRSCNSEQMDA